MKLKKLRKRFVIFALIFCTLAEPLFMSSVPLPVNDEEATISVCSTPEESEADFTPAPPKSEN